jgi:hypothetical protein
MASVMPIAWRSSATSSAVLRSRRCEVTGPLATKRWFGRAARRPSARNIRAKSSIATVPPAPSPVRRMSLNSA